MSCAIKDDSATKAVRKRLLQKHTLKAVISMPDDLFYPVGVVTCIMVFEANSPNKGKKTWFGYLKDDGFTKRKNKGRIDFHNRWKNIKSNFIQAYINNEEVVGLSVKKEVNYDDEWCAEAYMQTDYSTITSKDFEEVMKKYVIFKTIGLNDTNEGDEIEED
jgi:type I restriction-modification system DNA methylase subunit